MVLLCCPGRTVPRHFVMQPRARRPSDRTNMGTLPARGRAFYPQPWLRHPAATRSRRLRRPGPPDRGVTRTRVVRSVAARGGSPRFRLVSVSALPLAVAAWGVVRRGGRRLRACRCSRGRRPIGSDTEATDPLEPLPQRHRSGVGGRLTRTRLRHACRLQRPCSLPRCSC